MKGSITNSKDKTSMKKNLVIVESPSKAKTIEKFLGRNFVVRSCNGHVRDLQKSKLSIDIANHFMPIYTMLDQKKAVIAALKKEVKKVDGVYLATDDDREGEAISWHLCHALALDTRTAQRIVFREITQKKVVGALQNPRGIDSALVDAQQARRVLDRLVGFMLSPLLWKKVKRGLSAGRVQSVAVRLIVDNENDIAAFKESSYHTAVFHFKAATGQEVFVAKLSKKHTQTAARAFLESCKNATFAVQDIKQKEVKRMPPPPLTTSFLQQEAHQRFSYAVGRTMRHAQSLYESGKITYMRTDSAHLAQEAIEDAKAYITATFGANYSRPTQYTTKTKKAQEAHEAIRPTDFSVVAAGGSREEQQLYKLIRNHTLASQMAPARLERTVVHIGLSTNEELLVAEGEVMVFDGFTKLYATSSRGGKQPLPAMTKGETFKLEQAVSREHFTRPPARYNEASLVKKLEEMGIGRPSTYAPIIDTIQKRNYVRKESRAGKERHYTLLTLAAGNLVECTEQEKYGEEKNKLFSTDEAIVVTDFLYTHFSSVMDYSFTASMEEELDNIAAGKIKWQTVIEKFYTDFHPQVERVTENKEIQAEKARLLGQDPISKKNVYARLGRYGPYVQLGEIDEEKPKSSSLKSGQFISSITLEEALLLFRLPRSLEDWKDEPLVVSTGKYGPYVRHGKKFYSLDKSHDPYTLSQQEAIAWIEEKIQAEKERIIATYVLDDLPLELLRGRYGPYVRYNGKNYKLSKAQRENAEQLTQAACIALIKKEG